MAKVEARRRFVQQHHPRPLGQRASEYHPLPFAARQTFELAALEPRGFGLRHCIPRYSPVFASLQLEPSQVSVSPHQHSLQGGKRMRRVLLGHERDAPRPFSGVHALDTRSSQAHTPRVRPEESGQRPKQRALAGAVRPDDAHQFARASLERDRPENLAVSKPQRHVVRAYRNARVRRTQRKNPCRFRVTGILRRASLVLSSRNPATLRRAP